MTTTLGNLVEKQAELKEQARKFAQDNVKPALKSAFEDLKRIIPNLTAVRWEQFTPHFNDGDECVFSVHGVYVNLGTEEGGDYDDGFYYASSPYDEQIQVLGQEQQTALKTLSKNIHEIEDLLKVAFGDHTRVKLTETGIETEEYSHD